MQHSRHRDHAVQGRHDAIFAIDPMSRRQQFTGRFLPHDIAADRGPDQVGRVGLPTLELLHLDSLAEDRNLVSKIRGESGYIEAVVVRNFAGNSSATDRGLALATPKARKSRLAPWWGCTING